MIGTMKTVALINVYAFVMKICYAKLEQRLEFKFRWFVMCKTI